MADIIKDDFIKRSDVLELSRIYFSPDLWEEAVPVKAIRNIPSADVAEVRHGEWVGKPIAGFCTVRCSNCGEVFLDNEGKWNFCPNCGADMRKDGE